MKTEVKIPGIAIVKAILKLPHEHNEYIQEKLEYADVKKRTYVLRQLPIEMLRKQDSELDYRFREPLKHDWDNLPPVDATLRPGYMPILIGNKMAAGRKEIVDGVIDGFQRIAAALNHGYNLISAYVPWESPLTKIRWKGIKTGNFLSGEEIISEILSRKQENNDGIRDDLAYAEVHNRRYRLIEMPIDFLRKKDKLLDGWLNEPVTMEPLYPGYTPILLGRKSYGEDEDLPLVDGFHRVASAVFSGRRTIKAYVPEDSPLIRQAKQWHRGMKL
ncbi:hypothetical protein [Olivibacter jilunii]|uniref:hypothetical protein n=1 Tax=Olivibacter jilunii TaxID=985016 RepID=UPI0010323AC6|nr:hypothetical protein [Olivibacter jilunii]